MGSPISLAPGQNMPPGIVTEFPALQQTADQRGHDAPTLPRRTQGSFGPMRDLMDENDNQDGEMESWKPLRPR